MPPAAPRTAPADRLVDVAVRLAAREGIEALAPRRIARRAGVSHGAPLRHFASLADLLSDVAARGFRLVSEAIEGSGDGLPTGAGALPRLAATGRAYVEWHLVRRTPVGGSRNEHYEAATNFWRVMRGVMERRFRWNLRQELAAAAKAEGALEPGGRGSDAPSRESAAFITGRLTALRLFFTAVDAAISAFTQCKSVDGETLRNVVPVAAPAGKRR
jgi:AcrR family transcriptional regulator